MPTIYATYGYTGLTPTHVNLYTDPTASTWHAQLPIDDPRAPARDDRYWTDQDTTYVVAWID